MKNSLEVKYELVSGSGNARRIEERWKEKGEACNPLNPCLKGWDLCFKKKSYRQVTSTSLITSRHDNRCENGNIILKQVTSFKKGDVHLMNHVSVASKVGESSKMSQRKVDTKKENVFTRLSKTPARGCRNQRNTNATTPPLREKGFHRHSMQPSTSEKKQLDIQKHMSDFLNMLLTENSEFKDAYGNIITLLNDLSHLSEPDYVKTILKISQLDAKQVKYSDFDLTNFIDYNYEFIEKPKVSCDRVVSSCKHSSCHFKLEDPKELVQFDHREPLIQELKSNKKYSKILQNLPLKPSFSDHSSSTMSTPVVKMRRNFKSFKPSLSKSVKSLNNCFSQAISPTSIISPGTPSKTRQSLSSLLNTFKPNFIRYAHSKNETADNTTSNTECQVDYFDYDTFPRPISLSKYRKYDRHHLSFNLHPSKFTPPIANLHDDYGDEIRLQHPLRSFTSEPNNINHEDFKYLDDSDEEEEEEYTRNRTDINNNKNTNKNNNNVNNNTNNNVNNKKNNVNNNTNDRSIKSLLSKQESLPPNTASGSIVMDILKAENDYVNHMDDIVEGFLYKSFSVLSEDDIKKIFGNIEHVRTFSRDFVEQLRSSVAKAGRVQEACLGGVFVRNHRRFDVYTEYCLNNQASSICLSNICKRDEYRTFFELCRKERRMIELPLQAFLLTPVQKICKYPLQLKQLYRCTPPQHNDHPNLKLAIELMLSLATKINEIKKLQELKAEFRKFESIVGWKGPDFSCLSSSLRHTGQLTKLSSRGWQHHRVCFLFKQQMVVCKKDLIRKNTLIYKEHITLKHLKLQEALYKDTSSRLVSLANGFGMLEQASGRQHYWLCSNKEEKSTWIRAIKQLIVTD